MPHHPRPTLDTNTPAVILKLDHNVMHHGGLGAIRSLGRLGVPVYGVHEDPLAPAARSRYLRGRWIWRPEPDDVHRVRTGLVTLAKRIGRRSVLIPTDDAGAIFLAEHGSDLRQYFLFSDPPAGLPRQLAGKYTLYQRCRELGVPCAAAALPGTLRDARRFAEQSGFPLVAKLATPWQSKGAKKLRSTTVIRTHDDLTQIWRACEESGSGALMLQEYVKGWDYFFHAYCDTQSRCRPGFVGSKERSYPAQAGLTSLGRWVDNPALHEQASELLACVGFRGIVDLDYRFDPRTGTYKLLDFNPRLGAQFRLFSDSAGVDVVVAAHLDLTGRQIPLGSPHLGRSFLVENYDPIAALAYRRLGLDLKSWVASLRRADELAWFARDDLAPFGLMCLRMGWRALTRPLARRGTRRPITTPLPARRTLA
ncbi:MAG: carboxylate--amine ligase [Pseudonocardiales bacterium]|nr:carboxylate--amine ligase [Pseudonocardiales bacterium]MBV9650373.1 carboxylate--amine ligase [Pseudonocardiales bacterium]